MNGWQRFAVLILCCFVVMVLYPYFDASGWTFMGVAFAMWTGVIIVLSVISNANPKIANYPFTTLNPQLGVMYAHNREFVLVDLPGLIEGAHTGVGLGDRFLGHAERTKMILHVIDGTESDWAARYAAIRYEMDSYGGNLTNKPEMVIINKMDAIAPNDLKTRMDAFKKSFGRKKKPEIITISAAGRLGISEMISAIEQKMIKLEKDE